MIRITLKALRCADLVVAASAITLLIAITILGVVMRYLFANPLVWLEEVQMALIVWATMFGGSYAFRAAAHVSIDAIFASVGPRAQSMLRLIIAIFSLAVLGFLAWTGVRFALFQYGANRVTDVLGISYALVYAAVPIGALLMMLSYIGSELLPLLRGEDAA